MVEIIIYLLTIAVIWRFIKNSFKDSKYKGLAKMSSIFLAISPWYISLMRASSKTEASLLVLLEVLAIYLVRKFKIDFAKQLIIFGLLVVLTSFLNKIHILNSQTPLWATDEQRREHGRDYQTLPVVIVHNKAINYSLSFLEHYSRHFAGDFLFVLGDMNWEWGVKDFGLLYFFDIIFIFVGLLTIFASIPSWKTILLILILAPIPSALTLGPPNASLAFLMVVPLVMISAHGAQILIKNILKIKNHIFRYVTLNLLSLFIVWDLTRFLHQLFYHSIK